MSSARDLDWQCECDPGDQTSCSTFTDINGNPYICCRMIVEEFPDAANECSAAHCGSGCCGSKYLFILSDGRCVDGCIDMWLYLRKKGLVKYE